MRRLRVGVQVRPPHTTYPSMRDCWRRSEAMGVDCLYTWDHFFPLHGDPEGRTSSAGRCWRRWPRSRSASSSGRW